MKATTVYLLLLFLAIIVEFEIDINSDSMFQCSHIFSDMEIWSAIEDKDPGGFASELIMNHMPAKVRDAFGAAGGRHE
ncbi:MAG: hypothetical protein NTU95_10565 [Methanothrix sp.]|nr:hypothetical protein [Methanothrix sp.]